MPWRHLCWGAFEDILHRSDLDNGNTSTKLHGESTEIDDSMNSFHGFGVSEKLVEKPSI